MIIESPLFANRAGIHSSSVAFCSAKVASASISVLVVPFCAVVLDIVQEAATVVSTVASVVPGLGTVVSMGLDGSNAVIAVFRSDLANVILNGVSAIPVVDDIIAADYTGISN